MSFGQEMPIPKQMYADIAYLASDKLEGREPGTEGEVLAAKYIAKRFGDIGLKPMGSDGYFQEFDFKPMLNPHGMTDESQEDLNARNVLGYIDNGAEHTVVIGAHFDHLGYGNHGSLYTGDPAIHNGADDNASGVAIMLSLAKRLHEDGPKKNNYLFFAFSAEEFGLIGSNFFVKNPIIPLHELNYLINMDMVGRLNDEKKLSISATGTSPDWEKSLTENNKQGFDLVFDPSGNGPSDHSSFTNKGIPALHFFTGQHKDYHKPTDDIEFINFEGMVLLEAYIYDVIKDKNDEGKLEYKNTAAPKTPGRNSFSVTLGIMPDYLYQAEGMRIDGVLPGRVAEKHGILNGDIILKMGKIEVSDIYKYMEALNQYESGDKCKVTLLRGDKKIKKKVVF